MTDGVTRDVESVTRDAEIKTSNRSKQVREANVRYRARRRAGRVRLVVELSRKQLDALEERGYFDPFHRGNRADECEAVERFLAESLSVYSSTDQGGGKGTGMSRSGSSRRR